MMPAPSRRAMLAAASASLLASRTRSAMAQAKLPRVRISTELGDFVIEVNTAQAPISSADFLAYVDRGLLDGQSIYRIVTMANQPPTVPAKIEVIQFGWLGASPNDPPPLPTIAHEPTSVTHLRHLDGTISMARLAPGTASAAFFICIGDQPSLDFGGARNPDGQGFAAFGQVVEGMDVLHRIFARAEATDRMQHPIPITRAVRLPS